MAENREIERKFLVKSNAFKTQATAVHTIAQGYLCKDHERTIRVRIRDDKAFLTIKSSIGQQGITRFEWEREIDIDDARQLIAICLQPIIEKERYIIPCNNERKWEVDIFHGHKEGLVLAELELGSEDEPFDKPAWLGDEVTGLPQYYNANM